MAELSSSYPLFFIVGPTAVGKSHLALACAQKLNGAVVNFDSLQFYKDIHIGTAKPSKEERQLCPHFLFDICEGEETYTAGKFRRDALEVIDNYDSLYPLFFVGGSGFYLQALERGMYDVEHVPEAVIQQVEGELQSQGLAQLFMELKDKDSIYAEKIGESDQYRIFRAICLMRAFAKPMTKIMKDYEQKREQMKLKKNYYKTGLYLEREVLRRRVVERTQKMLASGWLEETEKLLTCLGPSWPPLSSVGYKEVVSYLKQQMNYEQMYEKIITNTMRLAKRQMTWFRRDKSIKWFDAQNLKMAMEPIVEVLAKENL